MVKPGLAMAGSPVMNIIQLYHVVHSCKSGFSEVFVLVSSKPFSVWLSLLSAPVCIDCSSKPAELCRS
jgi:hypothetical protein